MINMQSFCECLEKTNNKLLREKTECLQINLGYSCNLNCHHCHVEAGPNRTEKMSLAVVKDCLQFVKKASIKVVDITGGAPETNENLPYLIGELRKIKSVKQILVRSNLAILDDAKYTHLIKIFMDNKVDIVASMPCYLEENVEAQRGQGVYAKNIKIMQKLNALGYATMPGGPQLHLVYNPGGAFLPGPQYDLESAYKKQLKTNFNITFNSLYTITNAPVGRFRKDLEEKNEFNSYMKLLEESYNPENLKKVMCLKQVNVDWQGYLYDCDFNQALKMPMALADNYIGNVDPEQLVGMPIDTGCHCYTCVAGAGSSCQGSLDHKAS